MDDKRIGELADLIKKHGLAEIELEENGVRIKLVSGSFASARGPVISSFPVNTTPTTAQASASTSLSAAETIAGHKVKSPFVGTFYASSSPEKPPFAKVGDRVRKGQVLCIVEAMKIMNEIEADRDGVVDSILVENEDAVEFDQALFVLS